MKKNISINIFGTIYAIDEDAYQLLENYLQSMKQFFRSREGGEEIADDIEHRVAELLWQYKQQGMEAVSIETIREIIEQVGNPDEITDEAPSSNESLNDDPLDDESDAADKERSPFATFKRQLSQRTLYRDTDNKMLAGVCSGIAVYTGILSATFWRFMAVVLTLCGWGVLSWLIPALYVLMWLIVPAVVTPEDRLRMHGRKVTPNNIRQQVMSDAESSAANTGASQTQQAHPGCLRVLLTLLLAALLLPLGVFVLVAIILMLIIAISTTFISWGFWPNDAPSIDNEVMVVMQTLSTDMAWVNWIAGIAFIIVLAIPMWAIVRYVFYRNKPLSRRAACLALFGWLIASVACIAASAYCGKEISKAFTQHHTQVCTRNNITLQSQTEWEKLDALGWTLVKMENVEDKVTCSQNDLGEMPPYGLRLRRKESNLPITVQLKRVEHLTQGTYVLEALVETSGKGAELRVTNEGNDTTTLASLQLGKEGSKLAAMDMNEMAKLPILFEPDSTTCKRIQEYNDLTYYVSEPFKLQADGNMTVSLLVNRQFLSKLTVRQVQFRKMD